MIYFDKLSKLYEANLKKFNILILKKYIKLKIEILVTQEKTTKQF